MKYHQCDEYSILWKKTINVLKIQHLIKNHPAYKDIKLKKYEDWVKTCPSLFEHTEQSNDEEDLKDSDYEEIINFAVIR